jgi:hypothetical protein
MLAATTGSPKISPHRPNGLFGGADDRGAFVAGGHELEEQVGGFGFEGDASSRFSGIGACQRGASATKGRGAVVHLSDMSDAAREALAMFGAYPW